MYLTAMGADSVMPIKMRSLATAVAVSVRLPPSATMTPAMTAPKDASIAES